MKLTFFLVQKLQRSFLNGPKIAAFILSFHRFKPERFNYCSVQALFSHTRGPIIDHLTNLPGGYRAFKAIKTIQNSERVETMKLHEEAKQAISELSEFVDAGFPGASLEQLVRMTSHEPENSATSVRLRAQRNVDLIVSGCWEIWEELCAANVAPEYRLAVYKERMGVRKGKQAFELMECRNGA